MREPHPTIAVRYDHFTREMTRLLGGRCCECELPGLEVMLARAHAQFVAALPHLEQLERGCTRAELGALQCALIDKAGFALFAVVVAVASEIGMSLTEPARLDAGRIAAFEMMVQLAPFLDEPDAAAHVTFMSPVLDCDGEMVADHAS
ncbi:MAG: hypothetical protein ABI467_06715 [Kofleriaceae bacterium]